MSCVQNGLIDPVTLTL